MSYLPWMVVATALIGWFDSWYRSKDEDYEEGSFAPKKLVSWGTCVSSCGRDRGPNFRYFSVRLPFIRSWEMDYPNGEYCWCYLAVRMFAGKWRTHWVPG